MSSSSDSNTEGKMTSASSAPILTLSSANSSPIPIVQEPGGCESDDSPPPFIKFHKVQSASTAEDMTTEKPPISTEDRINTNRWLMRVMRLGQGRYSGSSGYGQHTLSVSAVGSRGRRKSAIEVNLLGGGGCGGYLRPPVVRGRRFSDSMNFATANRSRSRKGDIVLSRGLYWLTRET